MGRYLVFLGLWCLLAWPLSGQDMDTLKPDQGRDLFFVLDMSPSMAGAVLDSTGRYRYAADHDHRKEVLAHITNLITEVDTAYADKKFFNIITYSSDVLDYRYFDQTDSGRTQALKYVDSLMTLEPKAFGNKANICRMLERLPDYVYFGDYDTRVYFFLASLQAAAYGDKGSLCLVDYIEEYCDAVSSAYIEHYWVLLDDILTPAQRYTLDYDCSNHAVLPYMGYGRSIPKVVDINLFSNRMSVNIESDSFVYSMPFELLSKGDAHDLVVDSLRTAVITNWSPHISAFPEQVSLRDGKLHIRFRNMKADSFLLKDGRHFMAMLKLMDHQDDKYYYNFISDTVFMELRRGEPARAYLSSITLDPEDTAKTDPEDVWYTELGGVANNESLKFYVPVSFNEEAVENASELFFRLTTRDFMLLDTSEFTILVDGKEVGANFTIMARDYAGGWHFVPVELVFKGRQSRRWKLNLECYNYADLYGGLWVNDRPMRNYENFKLEFNTYYDPLVELGWQFWLVLVVIMLMVPATLWLLLVGRPVFMQGYLYFYSPVLKNPTVSLKFKHKLSLGQLGIPVEGVEVVQQRVSGPTGKERKAVLICNSNKIVCLLNGQEVSGEKYLQNFDEVIILDPQGRKELVRFVFNNPRY